MNEIKLVFHKDAGLSSDMQSRLDKVREILAKKSGTEWVWTTVSKENIGLVNFFEKKDVDGENIETDVSKLLEKALEKCENRILEKLEIAAKNKKLESQNP